MEMYTGPEHGPTETYMMPGTSSNSHITLLPPPEETNYMGNEVAPEVVYDPGLYYPAANYYGYYCTGVEAPSEWDGHHRSFGLDGQELQYSGLQTESFPYVYYPPIYGYAQSSYNPYNPYIPGAVIGLDGPSFIGTQQYFTNPSYQSPVSTPAYIPVVVHPSSDVPNSSGGRPLYGAGVSRQSNAGAKYSHPLSSSNVGTTSQRAASGIPTSESSQSSNQVETTTKSSEGSLANASSSKQASSLGTMTSGSVTQMAQSQGRNSSGLMQATDHFPHGRVSSVHNPLKVTSPSGNVIPNFASNIRGWATVRPRFHYTGVVNNGNGSPDILGEQNRGPRTNRSKGQWTPATSDGSHMTKAGARNAEGTIIIYADQYNRDDFPVDYPDAKFFVIKSYSEDDVHKSIKYNVWSSTPNGNKRLDSAYEDAQKISAGKPRNCPIFLFFSVNASGQFCGVAEMIGPVDFHKDMDFWQQDKWTGSFPVKWHIIKDVPNTSFRHIILENNENKPVTNSRDTQEVTYIPGMNMLKIFRSSPLKTSILDDFMFYEERQRVMQEEKSRYLGRSYNTYLAAIVSANQPNDTSTADLANQPPEDGELPSGKTGQPPKADAKHEVDQPLKAEGVSAKPKCHKSSGDEQQVTSEPHAIKPSDDKKDSKPDPEGDDGNVTSTIVKMELLSIDSKEGGANSSEAMAAESSTRTDVVTVGSMQIKVNGVGEPSSKIITIGSIPIDPNVLKFNIQGDV